MTEWIYKIVGEQEWRDAESSGVYDGSADDRRDGFIHLSTAAQLEGTVRRHFADRGDLLCVAVDADGLDVRWEPSRDGQLFPHLYGALPLRAVRAVERYDSRRNMTP